MTELSIDEFEEEPLALKEKLATGSSGASIYLLTSLSMTPIVYYYNVLLGVNAGLIAMAWLIFAIWNALNDPLFAIFQERVISKKYGRRIPYLRFGAPFLGLFFILLWFPFLLVDISNEGLLFLYFLINLLLYDTIYTLMASANGALQYEIAFTQKERSNLFVYTNLTTAIATGIVLGTPVLLLYTPNNVINPALYPSFALLCLISVSIIILASYIVKEKPYLKYEEPLGFVEGIKCCFQNKPFLIFSGVNVFTTITNTIFLTGIVYYILIVLNPPFYVVAIILLGVFASFIIFIGFLNKMITNLGLKYSYLVCVGIGVVGFFLLFTIGWDTFTGWNIYYAILPLVFVAIGYGSLSILNPAINGENIDYDEDLTGKRREVTYGGVGALFAKPAISIANALFLYIIDFYKFNPSAGSGQSGDAIFGLMIGFALIPGISLLIAGLFLLKWPLYGPEWQKTKEELKKIHMRKEIAYLKSLEEKGLVKRKQD